MSEDILRNNGVILISGSITNIFAPANTGTGIERIHENARQEKGCC